MLTIIVAAAIALPQDGAKAPAAIPAAKIVPVAAPAQALPEEPTLGPGGTATFPSISNWVKGTEVTQFDAGKVYVLEFWATWCGPCKAGMPHLSHLQQEYMDKGVTIIGISDEPLEKVAAFVAKPEWDEKMQYTVCTDTDRSAHDSYMKAAMQNGIPCAFIVKDSVVQWIGHPQTMDAPIADIVAGKWDVAKAAGDFKGTLQAKLVQRRMATMMRDAKSTGNYDEILKALDESIAKGSAGQAKGLELQKFQLLVGPVGQEKAGYELGAKLVSSMVAAKDSMGLNEIAWFIVDTKSLKNPDYTLALNAAKEASSIDQDKNGAVLDTLAAAYWKLGNAKAAVETQEKAVSVTPAGPMLDEMKTTLETYKAGPSDKSAG